MIQEVKTRVEVIEEGAEESEAQILDEGGENLPMQSERKKEMQEELEERSKE